MITITQGESWPIFLLLRQDGVLLTPDMLQDLEVHIGDNYRKLYSDGGVKFDAEMGKWYIFPTVEETAAMEEGTYKVCCHFCYYGGERYIRSIDTIRVKSCE